MYNIEELNSMGQEQLKEIAKSMGLKKINDIETDELIYKILDQQAIDLAQAQAQSQAQKAAAKKRKTTKATKEKEPAKADDAKAAVDAPAENAEPEQKAASKSRKTKKTVAAQKASEAESTAAETTEPQQSATLQAEEPAASEQPKEESDENTVHKSATPVDTYASDVEQQSDDITSDIDAQANNDIQAPAKDDFESLFGEAFNPKSTSLGSFFPKSTKKLFTPRSAKEREEAAKAADQVAAEESRNKWVSGKSSDDILVLNAKDLKGLDYKMAKCCNPVFGDDVFGFVTRTDGIKIHRMSCPNAARLMEMYPYRIQKVRWADTPTSGTFQATLRVITAIEPFIINQIMDIVNTFRATLRQFNVNENQRNGTYDISMKLSVPSNMELDKIISQIKIMKNVVKVVRQ